MTRIASAKVNHYPFYSPRFWAGMKFGDYCGLLASGKFRIHPLRYPMTVLVGGCAAMSSGLSLVQNLAMKKRIANVRLQPPIFLIGHWRSGTTLLHELLALDRQFTYPTTFQCFVPGHFLVSRRFLEPLARLLLPAKRPMDRMDAGARLPQEDEFALLGMGVPTPYRQIAFCNEPAPHMDMLNFSAADPVKVRRVMDALEWFYKTVSVNSPGRLVVKSPTHTGRIAELARRFPGARFVHISRHPYRVFPSTVHLWRSLATVQGYQLPPKSDQMFADYVHDCAQRMYSGYFDQRDSIPEHALIEIKFEDLVQDPVQVVRQIYDSFELPGFGETQPALDQYWAKRKDHRTNRTSLDTRTRQVIDDLWSRYLEEFGYELSPAMNG